MGFKVFYCLFYFSFMAVLFLIGGDYMSVKELAKRIGTEAELRAVTGLIFRVKVLDVKQSYGNLRYLVEPVAGSSSAWVSQYSLKF